MFQDNELYITVAKAKRHVADAWFLAVPVGVVLGMFISFVIFNWPISLK